MRLVVGALLVEQFRVRFPVEPAIVERPVGEADEAGIGRSATCAQCVAHFAGVEPRRGLHHTRIAPRDFFMAQSSVKVIGDADPEPVKIDIDKKPVAAGLDAGETTPGTNQPEKASRTSPRSPPFARKVSQVAG